MKLTRKNSLKVISATAMVIFTLIVSFSGAVAWYLSARGQSNSSTNISVKSFGKFESVSFHTLNGKRTVSTINYVDFNGGNPTGKVTYNWETYSCNTPTGDTSIALSEYDPLNPSHPLLAIFELTDEYDTTKDGSVFINATSSKNGFLGHLNNDNTTTYTLGDISDDILVRYVDNDDQEENPYIRYDFYYPLSSAVTFKYKTFSEDEYETWISSWVYEDEEYVSGFFSLAENELTDSEEKFVEIDNSNESSSFNQTINIVNTGTGKLVKYIAVVIDYDADAIEYIYSSFIGNPYLEATGYRLNFECDWEWEII